MSNTDANLTWVEIDQKALLHNLKVFRGLVGKKVIISPCVKANAYGHGLIETAKILAKSEANWLGVNSLDEAQKLSDAKIKMPIYIMGYVLQKDLKDVLRLGCRIVVYNKETIAGLAKAAKALGMQAMVHLKIETGNNRQGILPEDAVDFAKFARKFPEIYIEGISTHFANIEDIHHNEMLKIQKSDFLNALNTPALYPKLQLEKFQRVIAELKKHNINIPLRHCANSASTMLYPHTYFKLVRPGISIYGLWPSPEVKIAAEDLNRRIDLKPVLSWKTRIAQIKETPKNSYVGYGCTYKTKRKTKLAILPVGYYDGYDRDLSNKSHVLIHGKRAKILGRVCMNIIMVDVTEIPDARIEDETTLIGKNGHDEITAEYLAGLAGTINYEIVSRINDGIRRIAV